MHVSGDFGACGGFASDRAASLTRSFNTVGTQGLSYIVQGTVEKTSVPCARERMLRCLRWFRQRVS